MSDCRTGRTLSDYCETTVGIHTLSETVGPGLRRGSVCHALHYNAEYALHHNAVNMLCIIMF